MKLDPAQEKEREERGAADWKREHTNQAWSAPKSNSSNSSSAFTIGTTAMANISSSIGAVDAILNNSDLSPYTAYVLDDELHRGRALTLHEVKGEVFQMEEMYRGLVVIANTGLWYNSREHFRKELPELLTWLNELGASKDNLVLYRETSAQHWNTTDIGYFGSNTERLEQEQEEEEERNGATCMPLQDHTPELDWRNQDIFRSMRHGEIRNVHVIPFRDLTMPLHSMHPSFEGVADCTHFCYFPQMWHSVWLNLYDGIRAQIMSGRNISY